MNGQPRRTRAQILTILKKVEFLDRRFHLKEKGDGFLLQLSYMEKDIETGKMARQFSRKHYVSPFMTETEIVDTCFLCVMRSFEHVAREHFLYKGRRVQSPHFSMAARLEMCDRHAYDERLPLKRRRKKRK